MESEFLFRVGKMGKQWGLGEPAGRVWGVLLFHTKPLTQKEIAKYSNYSLGLISTSLKILEKFNMITNVNKKGKGKLYQVVITPLNSFGRLIHNFIEEDLKSLISLLQTNIDKIKDKKVKDRISLLMTDYQKIELTMNFFSETFKDKKSLSVKETKLLFDKFLKETN